jgi:nitrogen fixation/metabolism regulation signal transduction histidine kinase
LIVDALSRSPGKTDCRETRWAGIVEDDEGFLWLAGELGVLRVDPRELEKALLSPSYRLQGTACDAIDGFRGLPRQREPFPTATRAADGRLWFGTGVGLPKENTEHIFNAFFTTRPQGSGMGLSISRSIVESHGGHLWATANNGRGATFHFTLPTASEILQVSATGT